MESNVAIPPEFYISLFAGAAGLDLSLRLGMPNGRCVGFVEREIGAARILAARMEDGSIEEAPIWSDVRTFPSRLYRDRVAGIAGGFPCTDLSVAGKRAGITGEHSGLWFEYLRIIREVQPRWVFIENVPAVIAFPAGGIVLGGLAQIGFDAEWLPVRASDVGMPHKRERVFIYAWDRRWGGAASWKTPHGMNGMDATGKYGCGGEFAKQATTWPTTTVMDGASSAAANYSTASGRHSGTTLTDAIRNWPTPKVQDAKHATASPSEAARHEPVLAAKVSNWPSPRAEDSESCGNHPGATDSLGGAARLWTTPQSHDTHPGKPERVGRFGTEAGGANLTDDVMLWSKDGR